MPFMSGSHGSIRIETVLLDLNKVNYAIVKGLLAKIENQPNPTTLFKAVKNDTEIKNLFTAHIKDGVAVTKFMYWLKTNIGKTEITEISAVIIMKTVGAQQGCIV